MTARWTRAQAALEQAEQLFDETRMRAAYDRMAQEVASRLRQKNPVIVSVMVGGMVPTVELMRRFDFPFELDYLHATRYRGATTGADLVWKVTPATDLAGRHVLVVDDILDEGHTLEAILEYLANAGAAEVLSAVLVEKRHDRRVAALSADFTGVEAPDRYLFGCGMDYLGYLRQLPGIHAVPDAFFRRWKKP